VVALAAVDILKASQAEAALVTSCDDPVDAAKALAAQGSREVVITLGDAGSVVFAGSSATRINSIPARRAIDPTGCSDTYLAAYVALRLEEESPVAAAEFATAAASVKLETAGPLTATREEIADRLRAS
jgi:sugar/nucleoside kinase (ribokinase family)